jgi:hypothetical protein
MSERLKENMVQPTYHPDARMHLMLSDLKFANEPKIVYPLVTAGKVPRARRHARRRLARLA